jgi:hypothetical protein
MGTRRGRVGVVSAELPGRAFVTSVQETESGNEPLISRRRVLVAVAALVGVAVHEVLQLRRVKSG